MSGTSWTVFAEWKPLKSRLSVVVLPCESRAGICARIFVKFVKAAHALNSKDYGMLRGAYVEDKIKRLGLIKKLKSCCLCPLLRCSAKGQAHTRAMDVQPPLQAGESNPSLWRWPMDLSQKLPALPMMTAISTTTRPTL